MRDLRNYLLAASCCLCVLSLAASPAAALVYPGANGHTAAPTGLDGEPVDPGFDNVGKMTIGTGVYLGGGWVIAPYHVYQFQHKPGQEGKARIELGDRTYYEVGGSAERIKHGSDDADLICFRIHADPGLDPMQIRDSTPARKALVTMIAAGRTAETETTTWYVNTTPPNWVWDTEPFAESNMTYRGFQTTDEQVKRWGTNRVTSPSSHTIDGAFGTTSMFWTVFDSGGGPNEAQAVDRDSGGGVFTYDSETGESELAGLILTLGLMNNQPGTNPPTTAIYTNSTNVADLSLYNPQISAILAQRIMGDANGDGFVEDSDLSLLLANWHRQPANWSKGDFNEDGEIDDADLSLLLANWNGSRLAPTAMTTGVTVPEPTTAAILALGAMALLRRRRPRA